MADKGRQFEFDLEKVEHLASMGLTQIQIADSFGVHMMTISKRKRTDKAFAEAIARGKAKGIQKVANALFEKAMAGDTTAQIFFLKSRAKWNDRPVPEDVSPYASADGIKVDINVVK